MARYPDDEDSGWSLAAWRADLALSLALLTRLPIGPRIAAPGWARACRAFPLAGLIVGILAAAILAIAEGIGLPRAVAATMAVIASILMTGALHEDGLADTVDGFGGAYARTEKLAIMRDSRVGAFGVLALILSVALRIAALAALPAAAGAAALVAAHTVSRAALPAMMRREKLARTDGLAAEVGRPHAQAVLWSLGIGALVALLALGLGPAIVALAAAAGVACIVAWIARRQIGGYTGDVLGASEQSLEATVLIVAAAFA